MKIIKISAIVVTVIVVLLGAATWFLGPMVGATTLGKPVFLVATPHRYATFAFDYAQSMAVHGDTPETAAAREEAEAELKNVHSIPETHSIIKKFLKVAGGKHSNLVPPAENKPNKNLGDEAPTVTKESDIVTAKLFGLGRGPAGQQYADTLANGLAQNVPGACGVIVDLRENDGGDMGPMLAGVSGLLPDGVALQFKGKTTTPVTINGGSVTGGGTPTTVASTSKFNVPVALLTSDKTASSGEATLLSFRGLDNARTFGKPTAGYASANTVVDMPDGAALMVTIANDLARTGEEFGDDPIESDVDTDQPVQAATEWLRGQCVQK